MNIESIVMDATHKKEEEIQKNKEHYCKYNEDQEMKLVRWIQSPPQMIVAIYQRLIQNIQEQLQNPHPLQDIRYIKRSGINNQIPPHVIVNTIYDTNIHIKDSDYSIDSVVNARDRLFEKMAQEAFPYYKILLDKHVYFTENSNNAWISWFSKDRWEVSVKIYDLYEYNIMLTGKTNG